jgi:hypothetical protein
MTNKASPARRGKRPPRTAVTLEYLFENSTVTNRGCWEWSRCRTKAGYGQINVDGRRIYTHRLAYRLRHGEIGSGFMVRHECDNPGCCNPAHLVHGTAADNSADMMRRGRHVSPVGERAHHSKLTRENVLDIRARVERGETHSSIARLYGISKPQIHYIAKRKTWRHVL